MNKEKIELFDNYNKILKKAEYCLRCPTKPCETEGCPMHTPIPVFIELIKNKKNEEAYKLLRENNIFSHICSIICPQELQCEGKCIRGIKQSATEIGLLEEYVNYMAEMNNLKLPEVYLEKTNGKKVAIIGSGPASLECAFELIKNGFAIDVFEKEKKLGGILEYQIPNFRLNKKYIREIIEYLKNIGINFFTNKELGKDIHIHSLKEKYDAIFLGIGAEIPSKYDLGNYENIYNPDEFLKSYYNNKFPQNLGDTIIIGGGNVAMDCARVALKMGATTSTICYRRNENYMPARKKELLDAISEGVNKQFLTRVISAEGKNKKIEKINCIKTEIIDGKAKDVENTEFELNANSIVFAIGLKPNQKLLDLESIKTNEWGMVETNEKGMTIIDGVFAGGDLTQNKATVCRAIASGKKAACSIIDYLK